jgi:hypothetical protein
MRPASLGVLAQMLEPTYFQTPPVPIFVMWNIVAGWSFELLETTGSFGIKVKARWYTDFAW